TAVNDTGGWNIFDVDTVGSPTLGTIPTNSQYRYVNSANGGNILSVGQLKVGGLNGTVTVGSGTATSNGTAIASLTSQAQPAITITGATTTDTAICSLNAAPPASWQTGI